MTYLLGDLVEIVGGGTPSKKNPEFWEGCIPWASVKDFKSLELTNTSDYISEVAVSKSATNIIPAGNIIIPTRMALGKFAINKVDMAINQDLKALIVKDERLLYKKYLLRFLESKSKYFERQGKGATVKGITLDVLRNLEVPLPPLTEQKRIAAILDKADAIRRKRQQAIQLADEFLRAVFLDMFGDPVTNPKGWEVKLLKDISRIQIGPFGTQLHKEDYVQGGIPIINPTHIVRGNIVSKDDFTITAAKHASLPEYHLDIGDIIMGRRGEMGRCAVVGANEKGWLCGTGSLFIRPSKTGVFSEYLNRLLASDAIKKHLESESQGATMPNLNKTIVGNIQIPVPSDEALNQFSAIKEKIIGTKSLYLSFAREKMFESLSQKTFSGKL